MIKRCHLALYEHKKVSARTRCTNLSARYSRLTQFNFIRLIVKLSWSEINGAEKDDDPLGW